MESVVLNRDTGDVINSVFHAGPNPAPEMDFSCSHGTLSREESPFRGRRLVWNSKSKVPHFC
jgi:hypothetical protein